MHESRTTTGSSGDARSGRAGDVWAFTRLPLLAASFVATIALGYIGASRGGVHNVFDRLYQAIQLFGLENNLDQSPPVTWEIARFAAPALIGTAAVGAALVVFREEGLRARAAIGRRHTLIVGLGDRGLTLARQLQADPKHRHRVVGVELSKDADALAEAASRGIAVFRGDGTDPRVLRRAGIRRADHVVFATADDLVNISGASAAHRVLDASSSLTAHVLVRDIQLWRALSPAVLRLSRGRAPIEFVSIEQRAAADMVDALDQTAFEGGQPLLLVVDDVLGEAVLAQVVRRSRQLGRSCPPVEVLSANADALLERWAARNPHMHDAVTTAAVVADIAALPADLLERAQRCSGAIVATAEPQVALAAALHLVNCRVLRPEQVVLAVEDTGTADRLGDRPHLLNFPVVGVLSDTLDSTLLEDGTRERIARAAHRQYLRGRSLADDTKSPAARDWPQLDDWAKESSRQFAGSVVDLLADLPAAVVPVGIGVPDDAPSKALEKHKDDLARREHERWAAHMRGLGYKPGIKRIDNPRRKRTHPLLKDWEQLEAEDKARTYDSIEHLEHFLAVAGFRIEVLDGARQPSHTQATTGSPPAQGRESVPSGADASG